MSMRFAAGVTDQKDPVLAAETLLRQVTEPMKGHPVHAAFLFVSALYQTDWAPLLRKLRSGLGNPLLLGCTAGGVLAQEQELEWTPAMSLAAAHLPGVKLHPFRVAPAELEEPQGPGFWIEKIGAAPAQEPVGILIPEPFSCDCMPLVGSLNAAYPHMPLIGGLASGARGPGENVLFFYDDVLPEGAVGTLLSGNVTLQTVVSQGCRPIGRPFIVTKAEENVILELAGAPATGALQKLYEELSDPDKRLARKALLLGVVMNEYQQKFKRGDFLIRNLIGMDPSSGAIAIGDKIEIGQTIQFHVRDADTSREDLQTLLAEHKGSAKPSAAGALLFSCLGRGKDLYGEPHCDVRAIQSVLGPLPMAGFFCNGEIGPVGPHNYIHGFTSSLGLFRPRPSPRSGS